MLDFFDVRTFGAKGDGVADDTAAIQAAINALTPTGGTVYFSPGNYKITATLDWPDKDVTINLAAGAALDWGSFVGPFFRTSNVLTAARCHMVYGAGEIKGGSIAGQILYENAQGKGLEDFQIWFATISGITQICKNVTAFAGVNADVFSINYLTCTPPGVAGGDYIAIGGTPGNFVVLQVFRINHAYLGDYNFAARGWRVLADFDIVGQDTIFFPFNGTANAVNGFCGFNNIYGANAVYGGGPLNESIEIFGWGFEGTDSLDDVIINSFLLKLSGTYSVNGRGNSVKFTVNSPNTIISFVDLNFATNKPDYNVDIISGADDLEIRGGKFSSGTSGLIRNAALRPRINGSRFVAAGASVTYQDVGGGDFGYAVGCTGLSTGGGIGALGAGSKVSIAGPAGQDNLA